MEDDFKNVEIIPVNKVYFKVKKYRKSVDILVTKCKNVYDYVSPMKTTLVEVFVGSKACQQCYACKGMNLDEKFVLCSFVRKESKWERIKSLILSKVQGESKETS